MTWEVSGPFRTVEGAASPSTTLADAAGSDTDTAASDGDDGGSSSIAVPLVGAAVALGAVGAGALWIRTRRSTAAGDPSGDDPTP